MSREQFIDMIKEINSDQELQRQLKEIKNAVTIKALKVSADEVQDVIASRLIPMVQERENLIDSGKPAAANGHLRFNLL